MKRFFWFWVVTLIASGYMSVWAEEIGSIPDRAEVTLNDFTHFLNRHSSPIFSTHKRQDTPQER